MFETEQAPCLLFTPAYGKPGSSRNSVCTSANSLTKAYALLPEFFGDRHPEVVEIFSRNGVQVMSTATRDSALPTALNSLIFEMFELQVVVKALRFDAFFSDTPSSLRIRVDAFNWEVAESLFSKNVDLSFLNEGRIGYFYMDSGVYLKVVENFLSRGKTIGYRHHRGGTILHFAAEEGMKNLVKLLLLYEADVNARRLDGITPLHVVTKKGQEDIVQILLEHGADVNVRGHDGLTPLHIAATEGHVGIVKSLLHHGANVNAGADVEPQRGQTPLVFAHRFSHHEVAELLLESGTDVNIVFDYSLKGKSVCYLSSPEEQLKGITKATILYVAAITREFGFIKLILSHQPDVANECNRRAFHFVLFKFEDEFKDIFEQMKQYGFTIDYDRFDNSVEFLCAAIHKNCFEVVRKMVDEGAGVNRSYLGWRDRFTPLHTAARHAGVDIIKLLVDHGADVNVKLDKNFAIHAAVESNNINAVKYFVANKINFPDKTGLVSLAAGIGSPEMIEFLLLSGYPLTAKNEYIEAVVLAASAKRMEILELLFKYGPPFGSERANYWRPLQSAARSGHLEIFQTILDQYFTNIQFINYPETFRNLERDNMLRSGNAPTYSEKCSNILAAQILKLEAASLGAVYQDIASFWHASESVDDFLNRCELEVARMNSERVGASQVVFYDFLTQNLNTLVGFARNDSIVETMKDGYICVKFPIYSSLLHKQFKKGLQREELIKQGIKTCNVLFPEKRFYNLPFELKVKIIDFLSNCDLLVLNNILPPETRSEEQ